MLYGHAVAGFAVLGSVGVKLVPSNTICAKRDLIAYSRILQALTGLLEVRWRVRIQNILIKMLRRA